MYVCIVLNTKTNYDKGEILSESGNYENKYKRFTPIGESGK